MTGKTRRDRAAAMVDTFLEHRRMEQIKDYLDRGRRFAALDVRQLSEDWIIAVRSWLSCKDRECEQMMDDLTAELQLRRSEPPYDAVKQELAARFALNEEAQQEKAGTLLGQEVALFMRERHKTLQ
jgi:hypothetical protein